MAYYGTKKSPLVALGSGQVFLQLYNGCCEVVPLGRLSEMSAQQRIPYKLSQWDKGVSGGIALCVVCV